MQVGVVQQVIGSGVHVPAGKTLSIQPGTVIQFSSGTTLTVDGTLSAPGTAAQHIIFTSANDNSPLGGRQRLPRSWDRIQLNAGGGSNVMDHVEVRYAGGYSITGGVVDNGGTLSFTNSLIRNNYVSPGLRINTA